LILWNIFVRFDNYWWTSYYEVYYGSYDSDEEVIGSIKQAIEELGKNFKADNLAQLYDYNQNLTSIAKLDFKSPDWANQTRLWIGIENAIFSNFDIHGASPHNNKAESEADEDQAAYDAVSTALIYFYSSAGSFLVILAVMYWLGKTHKLPGEYVSILVRVVAGIGIALTLVALNYDYGQSTDNFVLSPWLIPVVMLGYFVGTYIAHG
jgi:hypothetical protein